MFQVFSLVRSTNFFLFVIFDWVEGQGRCLQIKSDLSDSSVGFHVHFGTDAKNPGNTLFPEVPCCFRSAFLF